MAGKKMGALAHEHRSILDEKRMAVALGFGIAISIGLMGVSLSWVRPMMMGGSGYGIDYAYSVPLLNLLGGMVWGFVLGALTGYLTAWVYNRA